MEHVLLSSRMNYAISLKTPVKEIKRSIALLSRKNGAEQEEQQEGESNGKRYNILRDLALREISKSENSTRTEQATLHRGEIPGERR